MQIAIREAEKAFDEEEVPIGAIVVYNNIIIGKGYNRVEKLNDASAHAEIIALSAAANHLKNWRLKDCSLYSTVEPCLMCVGACLQFRISKIVYGADDKKFGGCSSLIDINSIKGKNHNLIIIKGVCKEESIKLMKRFFKNKRRRDV